MKELVIVVGGGIFQVPAIREAQDMGYEVLVLDMLKDAPGCKIAEYAECVSTKNVNQAISCAKKYCKNYSIKGVFTAGTDVSVTVASIAEELGLTGIASDSALRATNKFFMRQALEKHNVSQPAFFSASSKEEAKEKAKILGYPLVIKPVDNMGARGVKKIVSQDDLLAQFDKSFEVSGSYSNQSVVIEEYMDGAEISMDTLVDDNGNVHLLTVADRHIIGDPYFVEIGHSVPSLLDKHIIDQAFDVMKQAIKAVGISIGAAKADIKITDEGAKIGEITARLSGGFHSQCTDPLATGMNSTRAALMLALGLPLDLNYIKPKWSKVAIERAILPKPGKIVNIEGVQAAKEVDGVFDIFLTKNIGDELKPLTSNIGKMGHIVVSAPTRSEAEDIYKEALSKIKITTL